MLELLYVKGDVSPQERMRLIETTTGLPQDITGSTVALEVRRLGATAVLTTTAGVITDGENGRVTVTWPAAVFTDAGKLRADVVITTGASTQTVRDAVSITVRDRP